MKINGTNFNEQWAKSIDEQEFVDALMPVAIWQNESDKEKKLREAWRIMNGENKPKKQTASKGGNVKEGAV